MARLAPSITTAKPISVSRVGEHVVYPDDFCCRLLTVDLPGYAEPIGQDAETGRPECFLERHRYGSVFGQRVEHLGGFHGIADANQYLKALRLLVLPRKAVGGRQHVQRRRLSAWHGGFYRRSPAERRFAIGDSAQLSIRTILPSSRQRS